MQLRQRLVQKQIQTLKQILSPRMINMMQTFSISYPELLREIKKEAQENQFIKIINEGGIRFSNTQKSKQPEESDWTSWTEDRSQKSLYEHIKSQLKLEYLNDLEMEIALDLLENIDERGFITDYTQVKEKIIEDYNIDPRKVLDILKIIQSMEPPGIGARSLKESLAIQIEHYEFSNPELEKTLHKLVTTFLDDLSKNNYELISSKMNISEEEVQLAHDFIKKNLLPNPGREYSNTQITQNIIPSFEVFIDNENKIQIINLEEKKGIKIGINDAITKQLEDPSLPVDTRDELIKKYEKAKTLVNDINERMHSLNRLSEVIFNTQENFVRFGDHYLEGLPQKEIAQRLQLSPSTVSRIVTSKYVQTPHGTYALKHLCPRKVYGKSANKIRFIVQDIAQKNPHFSDEEIRKKLIQINTPIARRTVTKYRLQSGVKSSYTRK